MSAFLPIKAGGWAFGEVLTSAQMNQLNTDFPFALNCRDGASYTPSGNIVINGLTISAAALAVSVGGAFAVTGNGSIGGGLVVTSNGTFGGPLIAPSVSCSNACHTPRRILVETTDASRTLTVGATDAYVLPTSIWTAGHTITLSRTGAVNGVSEFEILNYDTLNNITVNDNGLGTIASVVATGSPGTPVKKRFMFLAGAWVNA